MKYFILCLFVAASTSVQGQKCSSADDTRDLFGNYMDCYKKEMSKDFLGFEKENKEHNRRAALLCFAPNKDEAEVTEKCVLSEKDLVSKVWEKEGLFRDCPICRNFASGAVRTFHQTSYEGKRCLRDEIMKSLAKETSRCIRRKMPNFGGLTSFPAYGDLEEKFKENVGESLSDYIIIQSRLASCAETSSRRYNNTKRCLRQPFEGYLERHCDLIKTCNTGISDECVPELSSVRKHTCECLQESKYSLKQKLDDMTVILKGLLTSSYELGKEERVEKCINIIKNQMSSESNDWIDVIDSAVDKCIGSEIVNDVDRFNVGNLVAIGCKKMMLDTTGETSKQFRLGLSFVNHLLDAVVEKSKKFCGHESCKYNYNN